MFGPSYSRQLATSQAIPVAVGGDSERRRSLQSFLVWPFLLGAAFASDDLSGMPHATVDEQNAPPSATSEESHSSPVEGSLDPVRLSDWEGNNSDQSTQNLLPEPHFPEASTSGGLEQPDASTALGTQPLQGPSGTGAGSSSGGGEADAGAHIGASDSGVIEGVHFDVGSGTIGEIVKFVEGTGDGLLHGLEGAIGGSPFTLLSDVGHAITSLLGSSTVGESTSFVSVGVAGAELSSAMSAHASSDVVASGGTIAFGAASPESFMPQLTINGSYTDFGIAVQATSTDTHVASIDHPDGAVIDGGHSFDQHDTASAASVHLHDDTSLRTSMDLLG